MAAEDLINPDDPYEVAELLAKYMDSLGFLCDDPMAFGFPNGTLFCADHHRGSCEGFLRVEVHWCDCNEGDEDDG